MANQKDQVNERPKEAKSNTARTLKKKKAASKAAKPGNGSEQLAQLEKEADGLILAA